ncbi:hypothetical protein COCSUDRAFT_61853 [Coccomyxa subellipsoidea C-169]|uniref:Uncharacterized protein n=1 Tax=Coccomyxa subellipsoidea (strain C-169) TaxID=574566 RepID=I0Z1B0_COCSC|nr:hypothetical protein COCSUDRAFT_61853 [Coccomyxa subellipsoidea C-169]EIE24429.1 hypothetical protein COCSUDRAFT_61853 [Coccomyxa subellipsoidea C-169]|eukprot:XP_005648973.1 hypothetical protein COCSUDRAFT_61853 [Coccomyxa subellipsoidea C-169]
MEMNNTDRPEACGALCYAAELPVFVLGVVLGFFKRMALVFAGTYRPRADDPDVARDVYRAGLMADLNATVLAAAMILFLTSRHTFQEKRVIIIIIINNNPVTGNLENELWPLMEALQACGGLGGWKHDPRDEFNYTFSTIAAMKDFSAGGQVPFGKMTLFQADYPGRWVGRRLIPPPMSGIVRVDAVSQHSFFFFELLGSSTAAAKQCFNGAFAALAAPRTELGAKMGCGQGADTYVAFPWCQNVRCVNGAHLWGLADLNAETTAERQAHKFPYFLCLSYDELFGVYIGMISLAVGMCLTTFVLFNTEIVSPMLKASAAAWSPREQLPGSCSRSCAADDGITRRRGGCRAAFSEGVRVWPNPMRGGCRSDDFIDVILRCLASFLLGLLISMLVVFLPWILTYTIGSCPMIQTLS